MSAYGVDPIDIGGESKVTVEPPYTDDPISATRDISDQTVDAGSTFTVTLTVTADADVQAPGLEEDLPSEWTLTPVNNGGAEYNSATQQWAWVGEMSSGETKTVTYDVGVPADAASQDYYITGEVSAYGVDPIDIGGKTKVTVKDPVTPTPTVTPPYNPPPQSSSVPFMTMPGILVLIALLCIVGAGVVRGRRKP